MKYFYKISIDLEDTSALGIDSMEGCFVIPFERITLEVTFLFGVDE